MVVVVGVGRRGDCGFFSPSIVAAAPPFGVASLALLKFNSSSA